MSAARGEPGVDAVGDARARSTLLLAVGGGLVLLSAVAWLAVRVAGARRLEGRRHRHRHLTRDEHDAIHCMVSEGGPGPTHPLLTPPRPGNSGG